MERHELESICASIIFAGRDVAVADANSWAQQIIAAAVKKENERLEKEIIAKAQRL